MYFMTCGKKKISSFPVHRRLSLEGWMGSGRGGWDGSGGPVFVRVLFTKRSTGFNWGYDIRFVNEILVV